ncbi:MAG: flagellar hook-associated protein FlgK [Firmicutes bacterium HGW-Firmicutes-1]|jgi:flagellar hook-associated protein 1 FlgK|nr:MAG: flagellar hook-associated protein FlgK [Firmicutes bacterium HGW-Firmicutes-1]
MRSSFFGLNVGIQGLYTAQSALNVTNHNISNAETKGYSRQYAEISAARALPDGPRGMVGTGSEVTGIKQTRSTYIDTKFWSMSTDLGQYKIKNEMLGQLELLFNEPSDTGYNTTMGDFYSALQTLSTNPAEDAMVVNFIDSSESFAEYFNNVGKQMVNSQREANFGVKTSVIQINVIAEQLAAINSQIGNLELNGVTANDLRDERVKLIDQLSEIVNIEAKELTDINGKKKFAVSINGQSLVYGNAVNRLVTVPRANLNNPEDDPDLYDINWESGARLYLNNSTTSGSLKGYLDVRDGNNSENFKGAVVSKTTGPPHLIVVDNISRHDIPSEGTFRIGSTVIEYTDISYNNATTPPQMTFTLAAAPPASVSALDKVEIGEAVGYKGVPHYIKKLNEFVRTMAQEFNTIHKQGNTNTGTELFNYEGFNGVPPLVETEANDFSYNQINIHNFSFSQKIVSDNSLLLTSYEGNGESASNLLVDLLNTKFDVDMFKKGKPDSFMQSLISELGIDSKQAQSFESGQANLTKLIENQRKSISSVDLNEETADMVRFQQAYNLSAKIISVMDEIYNVMINQLVR